MKLSGNFIAWPGAFPMSPDVVKSSKQDLLYRITEPRWAILVDSCSTATGWLGGRVVSVLSGGR